MKKVVLSLMLMGATGFAFAQTTQTTPNQQTQQRGNGQGNQMHQKQQQDWEQMKKDLNLTPAQEAQIKALHEQNKADNKAARDANNDKVKVDRQAKQAQNDAAMQKILTPDQYTKWKAAIDARKAQHQQQMQNRKNAKAGA